MRRQIRRNDSPRPAPQAGVPRREDPVRAGAPAAMVDQPGRPDLDRAMLARVAAQLGLNARPEPTQLDLDARPEPAQGVRARNDPVQDGREIRLEAPVEQPWRDPNMAPVGPEPMEPRAHTAGNFRHNLAARTRKIGENAHHVFPQKFQRRFQELGIVIHEPQYGSWVSRAPHLRQSKEYNRLWGDFFRCAAVTAEDARNYVRNLAARYQFDLDPEL